MQLSWNSSDNEKRQLRIEVSTLRRANLAQKGGRQKAEEKVKKWENEYQKLEDKNQILRDQLEEAERQRDMYKGMLFKENKSQEEKQQGPDSREKVIGSQKRGAQIGHKGHGRKKPEKIDKTYHLFLSNCPHCNSTLQRVKATQDHFVEDIPDLDKMLVLGICYQVERQWCSSCKKEVRAKTPLVIPHARFGLNTTVYLLYLRYKLGMTLYKMVEQMETIFGIHLTVGGIINQLHQSKKWLGPEYERLLDVVRASPIKHADETGWRINGINAWMWGFMTKDTVYLTAEESRGKGVVTDKLSDIHKDDVLVRDDYAAYQKLDLQHQSCWAHLIRKSREAAEHKKASKEVKRFHHKLKDIYVSLKETVEAPYDSIHRQGVHHIMKIKLQEIIDTKYQEKDSLRIQTRISNQNTNLITALLHDGVPLTNNLAERMLRPLVITRKLTGGSRSHEGAVTHATNMSIVQTIGLQNKPIIPTLKNLIYQGATGER